MLMERFAAFYTQRTYTRFDHLNPHLQGLLTKSILQWYERTKQQRCGLRENWSVRIDGGL